MTYPWNAGEVLAAADLNAAFASRLPYSYGTATPSTTVDGFLWYDENSSPPAPKFWDGAAFQAIGGGGKILQIVRATDSTDRSTTSTTFVDANISVTITPQKSDSAVVLIWSANIYLDSANDSMRMQITDNSNNAISGAQAAIFGNNSNWQTTLTLLGYSTPATTSATSYKGRFRVTAGTAFIYNSSVATGQLFAIEVSA